MLADGDGESFVSGEDVAGWQQPAELLWRAARVNLEPEWDAARRHPRAVPGGQARIFTGASPFVSSLLLRLDDVGDLPPTGALVAVPHRRALLVTPLPSEAAAARIAPGMEALAAELRSPRAPADEISPRVFWWRLGAPLRPASAAGTP